MLLTCTRTISARAAGLAADNLRPDQGQFRAEAVEMQEGHGSGDQSPESSGNWFPFPPEGAKPEGDDTSPGTSWVPSPAPPPSDQPGYTQPIQPGHTQPIQPGHTQPGEAQREDPPSAPATELG